MTPPLIERLEAGERSNALDMAVEVALFEADETYISVRPNSAGTKLIYTRRDGSEETCWAFDHTLTAESRAKCAAILRAKGAEA